MVDNPGLTHNLGYGQPSLEQEYSDPIHLERNVEQTPAPLFQKFKSGGRE